MGKMITSSTTQFYDNKHHQEFVKRNIETRYRCQTMINKLNKVLN